LNKHSNCWLSGLLVFEFANRRLAIHVVDEESSVRRLDDA
jgi:hypothetical protein